MTKIDLEAIKTKKALEVVKWNKIEKVVNKSTLIVLWIIIAYILGILTGVFIR